MRRVSAIAYLARCRRSLLEEVESQSRGDIEFESKQIDVITRLLLDVRSGRVHKFELTHPRAVEIHVTD